MRSIAHPPPPSTVCLSYSFYDMAALEPLKNIYSKGHTTTKMPKRDMS